MGLSSFKPKTEEVEYPNGKFTVRGLSLEDFAVLLRTHYAPASAIFDRYVAEASVEALDEFANDGETVGLSDMKGVVMEALEYAPAMIGDVIARAADETENAHIARLLPASTQIDAIEKIVSLTLEAEGGMEKLVESVSKLAGSLTELRATRSP